MSRGRARRECREGLHCVLEEEECWQGSLLKLVATHCRYPTKRLLGRQAAWVKVRWGSAVPGEQQPEGLAERDRGSEGRVKGKSRAFREENATVLLPVQ